MMDPTVAPQPSSVFPRRRSLFPKTLPSVPHFLKPSSDSTSKSLGHSASQSLGQLHSLPPQLPPPMHKDLPVPPPASSLHNKSFSVSQSSSQPQKTVIRRRPVVAAAAATTTTTTSMLSSSTTNVPSSKSASPSSPSPTTTTALTTSLVAQSPSRWQASSSRPHATPTKSTDAPQLSAQEQYLPNQQSAHLHNVAQPVATQPEIWRRRPHNSSHQVSGLQLHHSHGSTISSSCINSSSSSSVGTLGPREHQTKTSPPPMPSQQCLLDGQHSYSGGQSSTTQQPDASHSVSDSNSSYPPSYPPHQSAGAPAINRPPTPEYQKGEIRAPALETYTSPASPASSPPSPHPPLSSRTPLGQSSRILYQSRDSSASPSRQQRAAEQAPRQRYSGQAPSIVQSEQGPLYRGRYGTLYPEMGPLREPDPRAFYFPESKTIMDTASTTTDGIHLANKVKDSHYACFQRHKYMNRRTNRYYPLTCQTCNVANADDRWACSFCHLRICWTCLGIFDANQRDLKRLMALIEERASGLSEDVGAAFEPPLASDARVFDGPVSDARVYDEPMSDARVYDGPVSGVPAANIPVLDTFGI